MSSVSRSGSLSGSTLLSCLKWTPQLEECVLLMIEDDGGKQTSWKASGLVKIKSKSYGFEVELPFRRKASADTGGSQNLGGNLF